MSDYFDRVERQLVRCTEALYLPTAAGSPSGSQPLRLLDGPRAIGAVLSAVRINRARAVSRGASRSVAAAVVGAVGGLLAALIVSLGASPAAPDFTVARGKGGVVTIKATSPSSIAAVNAKLTSLGIAIRVAKVLPRCVAPARAVGPEQRSARLRTPELAWMAFAVPRPEGDRHALLSVRVRPPSRPGQTLLLASQGSGAVTLGRLITGVAPACIRGPGSGRALLGAPS